MNAAFFADHRESFGQGTPAGQSLDGRAYFIIEDDSLDGPDHVESHRSPGFGISAYSRRGEVISTFYNTVSMLRTIEDRARSADADFHVRLAAPIDLGGSRARSRGRREKRRLLRRGPGVGGTQRVDEAERVNP